MPKISRYYREASVAALAEGHGIELDGKLAYSPQEHALVAPSQALAEAVAAEFNAQGNMLHPDTMPMTRLLAIALDIIAASRPQVETDLVAYGNTDLLYYRDTSQPALRELQSERWDPLLGWATQRYGVSFTLVDGVMPVAQPAATLARLQAAVHATDDYHLAGLAMLVNHLSSLILGLAVLERSISAEQAVALTMLDEDFQTERWGRDDEAADRRNAIAREALAAARFLRMT